MKRSSDLCVTPNKKAAIECNICYLPGKGHKCRKCKKDICKSCLKKWKATCNEQRKKPDCPFCRTVWDKPNFYIQAPGDKPAGTRISIYCGTSYTLAPISNEGKLQGFVILDPNLIQSPISTDDLTLSKLEDLEKYAAELKWLFKDLETHMGVLSTDVPKQDLKKKFQQLQVHLEELVVVNGQQVYGSIELEELFMAALVHEINPF